MFYYKLLAKTTNSCTYYIGKNSTPTTTVMYPAIINAAILYKFEANVYSDTGTMICLREQNFDNWTKLSLIILFFNLYSYEPRIMSGTPSANALSCLTNN